MTDWVDIKDGIREGLNDFFLGAPPTLRDQFAMAALQGLLASEPVFGAKPEPVAEAAFDYADAMLKAREDGQDNAD